MKNFTHLLISSLIVIISSCASKTKNNEATNNQDSRKVASLKGFRNFKLGSNISENSDLIPYPNEDYYYNDSIKVFAYVKKNENLNIGDLRVNNIEYVYYANKLSRIHINFKRADAYLYKAILDSLYGESVFEKNKGYGLNTWENDSVRLFLSISDTLSETPHFSNFIHYISIPVQQQISSDIESYNSNIKAREKDILNKSAKDL